MTDTRGQDEAALSVMIVSGDQRRLDTLGTLLLQSDLPCEVRTSDSLGAALRAFRRERADVLLLDIETRSVRGVEGVARFAEAAPETAIVALVKQYSAELGLEVYEAGAQDTLVVGEADAGLVARAVRRSAAGKAVENRLRRDQSRFREAFDHMSSGVAVYEARDGGRDFVFTDFNRSAEAMEGVRREDIIGRSVLEVFPGVEDFGLLDVFRRVWETGTPESLPCKLYEDDRITGWRENYVRRLPCGEVIAIYDDVTERRLLQERLLTQQKMEAIGTLAGGVAHDFGNLLSMITGYASSLVDHLVPDTTPHGLGLRVLEAARYAGELTKRLLSIARASDPSGYARIESVSISRAISDTVTLLEPKMAERGIECVVKDPQNMPYVLADAQQLRDAIMNLLLNAIAALPRDGVIRVDVSTRQIERPDVRANPDAEPGAYAVLRIRDNGSGIPRELLDRIFEAFYTTSENHEALGLGLSVVRSSVHRWGGWIAVWSRDGQGSSFRLFIPKAGVKGHEPAEGARTPSETILLIDDAEADRALIGGVLADAGYEVLAVEGGREGIDMYRQNAKRIGLAIVDAVMPGTDGKEVLEEILRMDPTASLVMTSGFSHDYVRSHLERGAWGFLQKPFDPEQLLDAVEHVLAKNDGGG